MTIQFYQENAIIGCNYAPAGSEVIITQAIKRGSDPMKIYLLTQDLVKNGYDSCVVIAHTDQGARNIHPSGDNKRWGSKSWVSPEDLHHIKVTELGYAFDNQIPGQVILSSLSVGHSIKG